MLASSRKKAEPQVPAVKQPEVKKLSDERAISPVASLNNDAVWYFNTEGKLFRVNLDGSNLSEFPLPEALTQLIKVDWPMTGSDFIAVTSDQNGEVKHYYDSNKKQYGTLSGGVGNFDWLPDSKRIAFVWNSSDNIRHQLAVSNADGTGYKIIKDLPWPDLVIKASPTQNEAILIKSKIEGSINKVYRFNLETGDYESIVSDGRNLAAMWLARGDKFIFTQLGSGNVYPRVLLYNFSAHTQTDLNINTDLNKLAADHDDKYLYAAIPNKDNSSDVFWKIDLATFVQEKFYEPVDNLSARDLFVIGDTLYFINARDGKPYYISK